MSLVTLRLIDKDFENRPDGGDTGGALGGEVRGSSFFRGDVGVFGGVRYRLLLVVFIGGA